jgi:hypothetical protein
MSVKSKVAGVAWQTVKKFAGQEGRAAAVKKYGSRRVNDAMKKMEKAADKVKATKAKAKAKEKPKKIKEKKKGPSKASQSESLRKSMRKRPEDSMTTEIGVQRRKDDRPKIKVSKKKKRAAQKKSEAIESYGEFDSRMNKQARQGGGETGGGNPNIGLKKDTGFTRDQAAEGMHKGGFDKPQVESASPADLIQMMEGTIRRNAGGKVGYKGVNQHRQKQGFGKVRKG